MFSSFGKNIKVTIFGGSHEPEIGVTITGLPRRTAFDLTELQRFLDRRAPGNSPFATTRKEADLVQPKSGIRVIDNLAITMDRSITMAIANTNTRSGDYKNLRDVPRPGHADFPARVKYGGSLNMSGGGPFSARMTAPLCIAGGIALQLLRKEGIETGAHLYSVGSACDAPLNPLDPHAPERPFAVISEDAGGKMQELILQARKDGDSIGGIVEVYARNCPVGLGGPMYDGVESVLAPIFFGIPAVKGLEFGAGFESARLYGSENNDPFFVEGDQIRTETNNHGGILGGITSGMPLIARLAFKPTPSIAKEQRSVSLSKKENEKLSIRGRHDPCVAVRAVPVCQAALAIGLLDMIMEEK
ncbi:chorismate synthase [Eubacteriales bacterium DFI.9.88]|nr:chorismate synthase [Eubacteriales bacterium DFI.9.88]